jgi:hypothetical protein
MPSKQSQIMFLFQNKRKKTNDIFDENSASVDIL